MNENVERKIPVNVSFSVKYNSIGILEKFNEKIQAGGLNRSAIFLKLMENFLNNGKSQTEKIFDVYCAENHLDKDAQLKLLMGPYRVANDGGADFWIEEDTRDFFQKMEDNKNE